MKTKMRSYLKDMNVDNVRKRSQTMNGLRKHLSPKIMNIPKSSSASIFGSPLSKLRLIIMSISKKL